MWVYFRPLCWASMPSSKKFSWIPFCNFLPSIFSVSSFWKPYYLGIESSGLVVLFSYFFSPTFCIFVFLLYFLTKILNSTFCIDLLVHLNFLHICYLHFQMLVSLFYEFFLNIISCSSFMNVTTSLIFSTFHSLTAEVFLVLWVFPGCLLKPTAVHQKAH